jgi:hypothetical protein
MCGTAKTPPPPPDYSAQKNAFAQQTNQQYQQQAERFNSASSAFNTTLGNLQQQAGQGKSQFGSLNIGDVNKLNQAKDFWSGLRTAATSPFSTNLPNQSTNTGTFSWTPPSGWGSLVGTGYDSLAQLNQQSAQPQSTSYTFSSGLGAFDFERPNFQSAVVSPYNNESVSLTIPNLVNPNVDGARSFLSEIDSQLANINNLFTQREQEKQRVDQYRAQYTGQLGNLKNRLGQLGIADLSGMNSLEQELGNLQAQRRGFSTALNSEYADFLGGNETSSFYGDITSGLGNLRQQRAAEENRIKQFEQGLFGTFDSARQRLSNLGIADYDQLRQLDAEIDDRAREARRFSSQLGFDLSQELDAYNEVNSRVDQLFGQRTAEENRIKNFEGSLLQRAQMLESQARRLGITNPQAFDDLMAQADALRKEASGFSSSLGFDLSQELAPLSAAEAAVGTAKQKREAEQARITEFTNNIRNQLLAAQTQAKGLGIGNLDAIKALDDQISALDSQARGFTAEIPLDFSSLYDLYGDVDSAIGDLYNRRASEEQRVRQVQQTLADRASGLARTATLSDYYDGTGLDALAQDIAKARQMASGFSSELGATDWGTSLADLDTADQKIAALRAQRQEALAGFSTKNQTLRDALAAANLYDEDTIRAQRSGMSSALGDLAMFRGQDAENVRRLFSEGLGLADTRLTELGTRRNDIETRARALQGLLRDTTFNTTADLDAKATEARTLEDEMNLYRANQASDEFASINSRFGQERSRIAADAAKREQIAQQERAAQQAQQSAVGFSGLLTGARRYGGFTDDEYQQLLARAGATASPFSRSIGLG